MTPQENGSAAAYTGTTHEKSLALLLNSSHTISSGSVLGDIAYIDF